MRLLSTVMTVLAMTMVLCWAHMPAYGQTGINYQAVARNSSGDVMANESIDVRFTVLDATSSQVFQETHSGVSTNDYGLFTLVLGSQNTSNFNSINWSNGDHELQVEVDNGNGFTSMGTQALQNVPYSLHADMEMGELSNVSTGSASNGDVLEWDGSNWTPTSISGGSSVWSTSGSDAYYNSGNVGIGTSSPQAPLDIAGGNWNLSSGEGDVRIGGPNNRLKISMSTGGAGAGHARINAFGASSADPDVRLGAGANDVLRVDSHSVSIGDHLLSPGPIPEKLHVVQENGFGEPSQSIRIEKASDGTYWAIGVGRSSDNFKFYFNGTTPAKADISSSNGAYNQISDRSVKEAIEKPAPVLNQVMKLAPKRFFYKNNQERQEKSYGFIAQKVEKLFPGFVSEMDDGVKGIAYDNFGVLAIQAIQEQQQQIDELKEKNQELRQKADEVDELKQRVRQLEEMVQK